MAELPLTRNRTSPEREAAIREAVWRADQVPSSGASSRLATIEDAPALFELLDHPGVRDWIYSLPRPLTLEGVRAYIETCVSRRERGEVLLSLNFDEEEVEALRVGLCMLSRSGDRALRRAADRISAKIDALHAPADWLQVSPWGAPDDDPELGCVSKAMLRAAVREERVLRIDYEDGAGQRTTRNIRPIAVVYHINAVLLAAWCELRSGLRHFRADRIYACEPTGVYFTGQGEALRQIWSEQNRWDLGSGDLLNEHVSPATR